MKLNELKQGMVCERRGGSKITIINENEYATISGSVRCLNENYRDDLTSKSSKKEYDIIKVMYGDKVVWERKESTFWLPEKGERYYFLRQFGDVENYKYVDEKTDIGIFKTVLVFKTEEEAEKQLRKQQATIRVIKEIARLNDGWLPNWNDGNETKYFIHFSYDSDMLSYSACFKNKHLDNNLYLKSRELAEQLIKTHEQDLKIMLEVE